MTDVRIAKVTDPDHPFDLSDNFNEDPEVITQTVYYKGDGFVLAIGELNHPNCWDDGRFDAICMAVEAALNREVAA